MSSEKKSVSIFNPKMAFRYNLKIVYIIRASLVAQLVKRIHLQRRRSGFDPGLGRSSGEGNSYLLQYSGLENWMDCIVHGVAKSRT